MASMACVQATGLSMRLRDQETICALDNLAYLCECDDLGRPKDCEDCELHDFMESGEAYELEHEATLMTLVAKAIAQLESWLDSAESKTEDEKQHVIQAKACISVMRKAGF
jgi:hypothetical protein